ncbi:GAF domain-containing protein [Adhaeribacter pallidiroseus]|uniref:GAF domain-containing protein n=1 Tax=Adhaeribacter pallidiroseus TaxID=2072847 RepID=A0A369QCX5_9BACT|nr:GAF domain-containing protein [Adhaeribacter pallidiroseus]RDC62282.1 hypothetical protein AHMF7616_00874 [Adhaeribacter pallidiroseus]
MQPLQINVPRLVEAALPFRLSFGPFVHYIQKQKQIAPDSGLTFLYDYLIHKFAPFASLPQPLEELVDTESIEELFTLIKYSVLPLITQGEEIPYAIGLPHHPFTLFYYSETFKQLANQSESQPPHSDLLTMRENLLRALYQLVLQKCYQTLASVAPSPWLTIKKKINGLTKYYRVRIDFRFMEPQPLRALPPLQASWTAFASNAIRTVEELPLALPLEQFTFEGFSFFLMEDVTEQATLLELKEVFVHLQSEEESGIYQRFEEALRNLCGQPVQIGLMPFLQVNGHYVHHAPYTSRSIFLKQSNQIMDEKTNTKVQQIMGSIARNSKPQIFNNLWASGEPEQRLLHRKGFRSFILYPLVVANTAVGMLEIGSQQEGALNEEVLRKIEQAIPLVVELLLYQRNQFRMRMEEIIRQKFTLLQPALEWKFNEAAWAYLRQENETDLPEDDATEVIFKNVHPFYGAVDVRDSSTERNKAIQQDLTRQFRFIVDLLQLPNLPTFQTPPEQLKARSWYWQRRLLEKLSPEEEEQVTEFLQQRINPYFRYLQQHYPKVVNQMETYAAATNATGLYNQSFLAYDQSLSRINKTVNHYLDQEAKKLQRLYPHYFEKFRTDGVEYSLYIGSAIAPWLPFQPEHLQQFRNWQLTSITQMARLTHQLLPNLPLPLQTTQLILAHAHPVDIKFRLDEHRFDVEGSYSIRYEVIKKRLDKAHIKNTHQRLTQPDTIALVYSSRPEMEAFLPAIQQLQLQKKLLPAVEYLEIDSLQGVSGLKALRLGVNYES